MDWVENHLTDDVYTPVTRSDALGALEFWCGAPFYAPSPLVELPGAARSLGLGAVYVKDEGRRFGPGSFKIMGAGYAMASALGAASWNASASGRVRTFYTATDGNHGRAVAWCAHRMGRRAVVLMPKGSARARYDAIAAEGANVTVTELGYDDCVRRARALADADQSGVLLQDTVLPGYEALPLEIMRGYGAIVAETVQQLGEPPTHVVLQAGVGSFAGAASSAITEFYPRANPVFLVAEAAAAPCLMDSAAAGDVRCCTGEIRTIMAGLACGEPNVLGLHSLLCRARFFAALPDEYAAGAIRALARGEPGDEAIVAGESGAAGYGLLRSVMTEPGLERLRSLSGLDEHSRVLVFNTETATDPVNYQKIVGNFAGHTSSKDV